MMFITRKKRDTPTNQVSATIMNMAGIINSSRYFVGENGYNGRNHKLDVCSTKEKRDSAIDRCGYEYHKQMK